MQPATEPRVNAARRSRPIMDSGALGMALFIFTEVMLFAGFISAFAIVKSSAPLGAWPLALVRLGWTAAARPPACACNSTATSLTSVGASV